MEHVRLGNSLSLLPSQSLGEAGASAMSEISLGTMAGHGMRQDTAAFLCRHRLSGACQRCLGVPPPGPTPHCPLPALMAVSGSAEISTEKSISQSPGASLGQQSGIRISIPPPTWNARVPQGHSQDLSPSVHSPGDTETSQKGHNSGSWAEQDILLPATPGVGGSEQRRAVGLCVQALHV